MTISEIDAVVCEIAIAAEPEIVYAHFTDPELYVRWMGTRAQLEPRPGGAYAVDIGEAARARGTFLELIPHSRIVFTFGWAGDDPPVAPGSSTVEVTLTPTNEGTHVRLVHRGLRLRQARDEHRQGWLLYLGRLRAVAAGQSAGPDPNAIPTSEE